MLRVLGALAKGFTALCMVLLFFVFLGLLWLIGKFAGVLALGFLAFVLAYVLVCECWDAVKRHWAKREGD